MSTEIPVYFSETDFSLVSADVFRPRGDWNTRFCSRNTFFSCFLYILDSFSTRYSWFSSFITGQVNMLWSCGFIQPITDFYRPFAKSMLHSVKSNKYKSYIFFHSFNQFILLFSFSSIDRPVTINFFYLKSTYIFARRPRHLNITCMKLLS